MSLVTSDSINHTITGLALTSYRCFSLYLSSFAGGCPCYALLYQFTPQRISELESSPNGILRSGSTNLDSKAATSCCSSRYDGNIETLFAAFSRKMGMIGLLGRTSCWYWTKLPSYATGLPLSFACWGCKSSWRKGHQVSIQFLFFHSFLICSGDKVGNPCLFLENSSRKSIHINV